MLDQLIEIEGVIVYSDNIIILTYHVNNHLLRRQNAIR